MFEIHSGKVEVLKTDFKFYNRFQVLRTDFKFWEPIPSFENRFIVLRVVIWTGLKFPELIQSFLNWFKVLWIDSNIPKPIWSFLNRFQTLQTDLMLSNSILLRFFRFTFYQTSFIQLKNVPLSALQHIMRAVPKKQQWKKQKTRQHHRTGEIYALPFNENFCAIHTHYETFTFFIYGFWVCVLCFDCWVDAT